MKYNNIKYNNKITNKKGYDFKMANREAKLIERTLKDFSLGALNGNGGGSTIVDALPAQGVEGTTYLLRKKDESKVFKAQCYMRLYKKQDSENNPLVMIAADIALLTKEITTKLNPDLSNRFVSFSELDSFKQSSMSSEEWQTFTTSNKVAIVKTEEEVSKLTEDFDYIFQDLGEIRIENITLVEIKESNISSGTIHSLANLLVSLNSYSMRLEKQGDEVVAKTRSVIYNSEATSDQPKYSFGEWQVGMRMRYVDTLTDTYIYDQEALMSLEDGDCYIINLTPTPQDVSYSYTQYVFDQGVYTPIGGSGARYFLTVYGMTNSAGNYPGQITIEVDTPNISTVDDLCNWFKEKGFTTTVPSGQGGGGPRIVYPNAVGIDNEGHFTSGFVLYESGDSKAIYSPYADINIYSSRTYTLTYINPEK